MIYSDEFRLQVTRLLAMAQLPATDISIQSCVGGGNNRLYRLESQGRVFAIKQYFRDANDIRNRLQSEYSFLQYAEKAAPEYVPAAYSKDDHNALALYEFIEGQKLNSGEIGTKEIDQAINFFCALNNPDIKSAAKRLPLASEVSFSIQGHLELIGARIEGLQKAVREAKEDKHAIELINELSVNWQSLVSEIKKMALGGNRNILSELDFSQRCVSPSDFGFHNALMMSNGRVRFIDFEYAGWDDPARMVGDFFSQLAVPVNSIYFEEFVHKVMTPFSQPELLIERARILRAVYQIKWCCIALNIFIPANLARRQFANPDLNIRDFKNAQLAKAERLLQNMETFKYG